MRPMMESLIKMRFYPLCNQLGVGAEVDLLGELVIIDNRMWSLQLRVLLLLMHLEPQAIPNMQPLFQHGA